MKIPNNYLSSHLVTYNARAKGITGKTLCIHEYRCNPFGHISNRIPTPVCILFAFCDREHEGF
jgi:hypothetical protein